MRKERMVQGIRITEDGRIFAILGRREFWRDGTAETWETTFSTSIPGGMEALLEMLVVQDYLVRKRKREGWFYPSPWW